ncbi:transposase [Candidatus Enterovibrio altilux]|uniref:transposase n=1 Tax=Candidatus Enterovibrio altilux TaxID=1927128 RepID=UPI0037432F12
MSTNQKTYSLTHQPRIIFDGAVHHRNNFVKNKAFILNIDLHYLPYYSSNLSSIEQLLSVMNEQFRNSI